MAGNKRKHGESQVPLRQAIYWARDRAYDLWQLTQLGKNKEEEVKAVNWSPPMMGWVKCNTDAAFQIGNHEASTRSCVA